MLRSRESEVAAVMRLVAWAVVLLFVRGAAAHGATVYPLKLSANGRYLVDQDGTPFRTQGDTAWSIIANLTHAEAEVYLSDRLAKGFNTISANLINHEFAVNAPANRNGDAPFISPGDFSTPNEAYFAFADSIIDLAAAKGMAVHLHYMYLGFNGGGEGWWADLTHSRNPQAVCYSYGLYLGNRYKNRKNIVWVAGGDYTPPAGSEGETRLHKILEGIKAAGAPQIHAAHWNSPSLSTDVAAFAAAMDLNAVYTYGSPMNGRTYVWARNGYDHAPARPAYLIETGYEAEGRIPGDRTSVRKYHYWAVLSGANEGLLYGHRDIWGFATDTWWSGFPYGHQRWQLSLDAPGAFDVMRMGQLLDSLPWYDLVPSGLAGMKTLVAAGGGTFGGDDHAAAVATPDGRYLLAYLPPTGTSARTITIDMTAMRGASRARWFNPTTATYTLHSPSLPNTGTHAFTTPGNNGSGTNDWVLVLDALVPPGSFHTLAPCRVGDTRNAPGLTGGPFLTANSTRFFPVAGLCGVPPDAQAVAINVTVVGATDRGNLRLYATGSPTPLASAINFGVGQTRANNAVIPLGPNGRIDVRCDMPPGSSGATHFVFDVSGYFK
jgi:Protein of unknown function (DUF4038)/Putative collagen-binding domain of a collagenase